MLVLKQRGAAGGGGVRRRMLTRRRAPQDGWTPLYAAACNGQDAVARVLVDAGADTEARDRVS